MSYGAQICFKTIPAKDLFGFFQNLKTECSQKFKEIAKDNFLYLPSKRSEYKKIDEYLQEQANRSWMRDNIFSFRYFYLPELELLGMFSIPNEVENLFDTSIYFQNSSDQDYEWEVWNGVEKFEAVAYKWQNLSNEAVFKHYRTNDGGFSDDEESTFDYDYYRKTFCYDEIWDLIDKFLYHESQVVYLSLYGGYEIYEASVFCKYCQEFYTEWEESLKKRANEALQQKVENFKAETEN